MEAVPSSSLTEALLVALIWDVTRKVGNIAKGLQIRLAVLLFQKQGPFFVRGIAKLPLNWPGTKDSTVLARL